MASVFVRARRCSGVLRAGCRSWSDEHSEVFSQVKKLKAGGDDAASPLSPEQLKRIAKSKAAALERLCSRRGPADVGESWRRALGPEFNKNYFTSVTRAPGCGLQLGVLM